MLKSLQPLFEVNPETSEDLAQALLGAQQFDVNNVVDLIAEMAEQNSKKLYPMFRALPCKKVIISLDKLPILITSNEYEVTTAIVDEISLELSANYLKDLSGRALQKCITLMVEPMDGLIESAFRDVKDYPRHTTIMGDIRHPVNEILSLDAVALLASCAFDLMAQQNLFVQVEATAPRHFRKRNKGVADITHKVIDFRKTYTSGTNDNKSAWHGKALHFVVGHWRRSAGVKSEMVDGQLKTWIAGHWRGDPKFGIIAKSYKSGEKFLASLDGMGSQ